MNGFHLMKLSFDLKYALQYSVVNGLFSMEFFAKEASARFHENGFRSNHRGQQVRKILVTRMDGLGDLVMTGPFLRELRRSQPKAYITVVVKPEYREVVALCPYINSVLCFDSSPGYQAGASYQFLCDIIDFAQNNLWHQEFDLCLTPRFDVDEFFDGFLCLVSGAPQRCGFAENVTPWKALRNKGYNAIYQQVVPDLGLAHEVERSLSMISYLFGDYQSNKLEGWIDRSDALFAERVLSGLQGPIAAISAGRYEDRRYWPVERYAELLQWLFEQYGFSFVLLGSEWEQEPASRLKALLSPVPTMDLTGKTRIRQMLAVLYRCGLYIGRDTGTKHLAAAAGVPVVEISCHSRAVSPTAIPSPMRYGPWGVPRVVVQPEFALPPCNQSCSKNNAHCIMSISVAQVHTAIEELMARNAIVDIGKTKTQEEIQPIV